MLYWLRNQTIQEGPYPKDEAEGLMALLREKTPTDPVTLEPAWEAPFERMIRVTLDHSYYGKQSTVLGFVYRVTQNKIWVYCNQRVGIAYRRASEGFRPGGMPVHHFSGDITRLSPEALKVVEDHVKGKSTWSSGWAPGSQG